jgi:uncharacterized Tic20 family protein
MAAIAHATIVFSAVGLIGPLIVWSTQREKSRFVAFQAVQAAVYQFLLLMVGLAAATLFACGSLGWPVTALLSASLPQGMGMLWIPALIFSCTFGVLFLLILAWLAYVGYGLYGAVSVLQGHDFRYVFLGRRLERYLVRS